MPTLRLNHTTSVLVALLALGYAQDATDSFVHYFLDEIDPTSEALQVSCRATKAQTETDCAAECLEEPDLCVNGFRFSSNETGNRRCCYYTCEGEGGCCPDLVPSDATSSYIVPNTQFCDGSVAALTEPDSGADWAGSEQCLFTDGCFGGDMPTFESALETIIQERADALRAELEETYGAEIAALAATIETLEGLAGQFYSTSSTDCEGQSEPAATPVPEPAAAPNESPQPAPSPDPTEFDGNPRCVSDYDWADGLCRNIRQDPERCVEFPRCPCYWDADAEECRVVDMRDG